MAQNAASENTSSKAGIGSEKGAKQENPLFSIGVNIVLPALILMKMSGPERLGPVGSLVAALALPLGYGLWSMATRRKVELMAILGLVSVLLTGGIGLLQLNPKWIAVKEAAVPFAFGAAILISMRTRFPLVHKMFYNDKVLDVVRVDRLLQERGLKQAFEAKLSQASYMLAGSFFLSALLNFFLARYLVNSPPGTSAFNEELGRMTAWSYPVITLPSMIILGLVVWMVVRSIKRMTGLETGHIFAQAATK